MEMWRPDDIRRDSWDWVGLNFSERCGSSLACENGAPPDWIIVAVAVAVVAVAVVAAVVVTVAVVLVLVVVVVVVWFVLEIDLGDIDHLLGNNKQHRVDDLQDVHQLVLRHKNIEDLHLGHELLDLFHCAPLLPGLQASHLRQRWRRTPVELLIEDVKELPLAVFWRHGALCCTCSTTSETGRPLAADVFLIEQLESRRLHL